MKIKTPRTSHSYLGYGSKIRGDMKIVGYGTNILGVELEVDTPFRDDSRFVEIKDSYFFLSLSLSHSQFVK